MSLYWLNYRSPDGRFAGVVVLEANALTYARMKAAVFGLDQGLDFVGGHELDEGSTRQMPEDMIGRLLDAGDLRRLRQAIAPNKPAALSIKRRAFVKQSGAK